FFEICLDVFSGPCTAPAQVNGLSIFNKKVILYGGEGNVKVFTSDTKADKIDIKKCMERTNPKVAVQVARPIALSAKLTNIPRPQPPVCAIPDKISEHFCGGFDGKATRAVTITLGVFSIVQIERNVQLLIPSYDFCIPEKECKCSSDNPCEVFSRLEFPRDEFFPRSVTDTNGQEGCGCQKHQCK
ncbi:MAG: hypothetical protein ACI4GZ_04895, partial [Ruminococcus sp.]